ncbi:hypothetical protein MPF19_05865 [Polaribacter sp. Z014]|uniref:SwmB domain-containing protein n=1 Tax=unclassified Polaribacter TaxID=196858 RepID=UPI00193C733E|nr:MULTISPECIES: SwmB domain-containing protein [unclassified Polaribacter]MCL7762937.1 hypothetical protein [Polaribacter sp. Z014]QVY65635.1 hypothetical protein JOP69_18190 [Polaribacter sp. Q13]
MKNIKKYILFFSLLALLSCEEDSYKGYTAPDDLSDVSWLIGLDPNRPNIDAKFKVNVDTYISFFDLSQGTTSHEWILEEGDNFLKEGFTSSDTLSKFINESVSLSSSASKAHVLFGKSGLTKIRLRNKFAEKVTPNVSEDRAAYVVVNSSTEGDEHVMDVEFLFDVYGNILPAFSVLKDGAEVLNVTETDIPDIKDESTWPVIEVEAATGLTFVDKSTTGRPNRVTWLIPDGVPNQSGTLAQLSQEVKFYKLGTYNAGTIRSLRQVQTVNGVVDNAPVASVEKIIPLKVKVIQSSQPFVFDNALTENENEVIQFRVTGELKAFSGEESNFTVNVKNAAKGFDQDIAVQSARVKDGNATFIELILSAPIYNSDVITVSYNGSTILSADERKLAPFANQKVQMHFDNNILPANSWGSFEPEGGGINNAFATGKFFIPGANGNGQFGAGEEIWARSTDKSYAGGASMRYKLPNVAIPLVNLFGFGLADGPDGMPAGSYQVSYWVYVEPGTTLTTFRMEFGNPVLDYLHFDISSIAKGKWVRVFADAPAVIPVDLTSSDKERRTTLRVLAEDNVGITTAEQLMYLDELTLIKLEDRP